MNADTAMDITQELLPPPLKQLRRARRFSTARWPACGRNWRKTTRKPPSAARHASAPDQQNGVRSSEPLPLESLNEERSATREVLEQLSQTARF
jgi:hypothetical protein